VTNHERAEQLLHRAEKLYRDVERQLGDQDWGLAVRRAQEVVELTLKGLLALMGVDYPKEHNPADVFARAIRERGLVIEEDALQKVQAFSARLARRRAPVFYLEVHVGEQEARQAAGDAAQMLKWAQEWRRWLEGV
jgi:HEPN domain-containing protein